MKEFDVNKKTRLVFNNLHSHSHYSLNDAVTHVDQYVKRCKELGSKAAALTEHGNLISTYELHTQCKKQGIKPILGIEAYVVDEYDTEASNVPYNYYHMVILCQNEKGWENIKWLQNNAWQNGHLRKPRIQLTDLEGRSEGLIITTACVFGVVGTLLLGHDKYYKDISERKRLLNKRLNYINDIFGENLYLEIQMNDLPNQVDLNKVILKYSKRYGRKIVVTNDVHYLKRKDWQIHDILKCRTFYKKLTDDDNGCYPTHELYLKSSDKIKLAWEKWGHDNYLSEERLENAIKVTEEIAEKVENYDIVPKKSTLPKFGDGNSMEILTKLCRKGYKRLLSKELQESKVYKKRLKRELKVIEKIGYPDYFLLVWDIVRKCKKENIIVGPGRGSVCGSLVAFLLKITNIDPIRFDLLFERFLNEDRISMPDIDMDFSRDRRDDVMSIMQKMYGEEKLAQIANYTKWKPRGVITDVGRVLDYNFDQIKAVTKVIDDGIKEWKEIPKEAKAFLRKNKVLRNRSKRLMNTVSHKGIHASGIVVTPTAIGDWVPTSYTTERTGEERKLVKVTEWDMYALEDLNLLKFDRLGLVTLDIIQESVERINEKYGKETIKDIYQKCLDDLENSYIYELIRKGELQGLFQIETSQSMARLIRDMQPENFNDIAVAISLHRTAVLQAGMHTEYVRRKRIVEQGKKIKYLHPMLEKILKKTYGVLVYQEQVMEIGHVMGNMTLREADNFRKAIKLKDPKKFKVWKEKFLEGAKKNNVEIKIAKQIWDWMYKFSGYGFNYSHAVAYGFITYVTTWLKYYHRKEFMASVMSHTQKGDRAKEKLPKCILESRKYFKIKCPHINYSTDRFELYKDDILFPITTIKGVGEKAIRSILEAQKEEKFEHFADFFDRVNKRVVNVGVISNIIFSDAFRDFGTKEEVFDTFMDLRGKDSVARQLFCYECDFRYPCAVKKNATPSCPGCGSASVSIDIDSCMGKNFDHIFCENNYVFGFNVKENTLKRYVPYMLKHKYLDFDEVLEVKMDRMVKIIVTITNIKKHIDRKENEMAFLRIRDLHSVEADLCIFASDWEKIKKNINVDDNYKMKLLKTRNNYNIECNGFLFDNRKKSFIKKIG